eukprot:CAMPEP_0113492492 /NCGR_PEP_ID=MMETSP0014_2-20120614/28105_1 /TAXON_ID=2857 /ORGANISM="Nitzschia sp." /LENGTH=357 /DNA_ID=CAMNT_0000386327 /DNA_START=112 /DNA_END=1185 /DNA_ORIENTATION=- /assembly_acc=CAM_ASM_000159
MTAKLFLIVVLLATPSFSLASSSATTRRNNFGIGILSGSFIKNRHRNDNKNNSGGITKLSLQSSSELEEISSSCSASTAPVKNVISSSPLSFLTLPGRQQRSRRQQQHHQDQQQPSRKQRRWLHHRRRQGRNSSSTSSSSTALQKSLVDDDNNDEATTFGMEGISKKQLIEIKSQVELPFSAEVAYDAYSNLPRQPQWSSWLDSVVFLEKKDDTERTTVMDTNRDEDNDLLESKWTMKFLGIRYSFEAVAVRNERPRVMQWKSTTGLKNFGTVQFHPREDRNENDNDNDNTTTLMTLTMTFVAPRAVSAVFRKNTKIASYVERNLITKSLYDFRDVVVKTDLQQQQQQTTKEQTGDE